MPNGLLVILIGNPGKLLICLLALSLFNYFKRIKWFVGFICANVTMHIDKYHTHFNSRITHFLFIYCTMCPPFATQDPPQLVILKNRITCTYLSRRGRCGCFHQGCNDLQQTRIHPADHHTCEYVYHGRCLVC